VGLQGGPKAGGVQCGAVDGGSAGHVRGKDGAMVASSRCPVKGRILCVVGGAGVAGVALACGEYIVNMLSTDSKVQAF
jgi:hypothetical protein